MNTKKTTPENLKRSIGSVPNQCANYSGKAVTLNTLFGEVIIIAEDTVALQDLSKHLMPHKFSLDLERIQEVSVFAAAEVVPLMTHEGNRDGSNTVTKVRRTVQPHERPLG